jgi:hypothetical protein
MNSEFRSPMDDEIDDVARSMTAASPSAALRSGVRARIAGRAGGSHAMRWSLGIAAAAAVIVLAILWPDREAPVDTPASRPAVATVAPPPAIDPSIEPEPTPPGPVVRRASPENESPLQVEMLELQPLDLEPLDVPVLALEAWDVEPLALQQ